jgi:signal transduction histidine kinase
LDALLDETMVLLADQLALQRVRVNRTPMPDGMRVVGNADLLQQVFTNLVLNACTAMPEGSELSIVIRAEQGGPVTIAFRDTGVGIPAEDLPHLFDPFFITRPLGSPSSGLGLSISYRIIEQHAGGIEVASDPGKGSTFTVSLPGLGGAGMTRARRLLGSQVGAQQRLRGGDHLLRHRGRLLTGYGRLPVGVRRC